ncbi:MAG: hypothetical protein IPI72_17630 [Flavobacteriales bacterium]|nr:hypothetical protein [Flavobacteriales bacterium]
MTAKVKEGHRAGYVHTDRDYHWVRAGQLNVTQGGMGGSPLHGPYLAYQDNGQLLERGTFRSGLKKGEWRKWSLAGDLVAVEHWRSGQLHGRTLHYSTGNDVPEELLYRRGKLRTQKVKLSLTERKDARAAKRDIRKEKATKRTKGPKAKMKTKKAKRHSVGSGQKEVRTKKDRSKKDPESQGP